MNLDGPPDIEVSFTVRARGKIVREIPLLSGLDLMAAALEETGSPQEAEAELKRSIQRLIRRV